MTPRPSRSTLFPYTTLFRSVGELAAEAVSERNSGEEHADDRRPRFQTRPDERAEQPPRDQLEYEQRRVGAEDDGSDADRSEEHTSELQSRLHLVCRLLLEKK